VSATPGPGGANAEVRAAARDALATIEAFRRGELDGRSASSALVDSEHLREIVPVSMLLTFLAVDAYPGVDEGDEERWDAADLAELRAEESAYLEGVHAALVADCAALAEHVGRWMRDQPGV
jgi:hypothetical protein